MVLESDYADYLQVVFNDKFGEDNVEREVYTDSGRYCDFLIRGNLFDYAVEVENTSEDVVTNGVAQSLLYSQELDAMPVVVYPPDNQNEKELEMLSSFVSIISIPYSF